MRIRNIIFGLMLMGLAILTGMQSEEIVVGEKICVDGVGHKNLEGFMCEETRFSIFGLGPLMDELLRVIIMLSVIGGFFMVIFGVLVSGVKDEK